ncbi:MAG: sugar phosphate isomerase/epimerase [Ruminococcaceae bacterium]|nr:sugar phosphate isomerase/epimerase [Oscillospiraceae bacterium]
MKMKLGISSAGVTNRYGIEEGFKLIKQSGFDSVDISLTGYSKEADTVYNVSEDEFLSYFSNIKKICDDLELEISQTHGRLTTCVPEKDLCEAIKINSELDLKASGILNAPVCVFHGVKLKQWEGVCLEEDFLLAKNKEFFEDYLTPLCEKYKVKFALETHGCSKISTGSVLDYVGDARNLRKSFDLIDSKWKSFCFDSGHTNEAIYYGGPGMYESIKALGESIEVLHLHDNQGFYDSHLMPLNGAFGAIDWAVVFDALNEVGYKGAYNWELGLGCFGNYLDQALPYIHGYLRNFINNKGRI